MTAKADLEKRIKSLKDRVRKADDSSEGALPPDKIRLFRKRLKRTQRKLARAKGKAQEAAKKAPAEPKPAEVKPPEAKETIEKAEA